jgi:hypothetical protein
VVGLIPVNEALETLETCKSIAILIPTSKVNFESLGQRNVLYKMSYHPPVVALRPVGEALEPLETPAT